MELRKYLIIFPSVTNTTNSLIHYSFLFRPKLATLIVLIISNYFVHFYLHLESLFFFPLSLSLSLSLSSI